MSAGFVVVVAFGMVQNWRAAACGGCAYSDASIVDQLEN
jgi:hypothetical protein